MTKRDLREVIVYAVRQAPIPSPSLLNAPRAIRGRRKAAASRQRRLSGGVSSAKRAAMRCLVCVRHSKRRRGQCRALRAPLVRKRKDDNKKRYGGDQESSLPPEGESQHVEQFGQAWKPPTVPICYEKRHNYLPFLVWRAADLIAWLWPRVGCFASFQSLAAIPGSLTWSVDQPQALHFT